MKLSKSVSDKRTLKVDNSFISIEHSATRELNLPDNLTEEELEKIGFQLTKVLKRECLMAHLIEHSITQEEYEATMKTYDALLNSLSSEDSE